MNGEVTTGPHPAQSGPVGFFGLMGEESRADVNQQASCSIANAFPGSLCAKSEFKALNSHS